MRWRNFVCPAVVLAVLANLNVAMSQHHHGGHSYWGHGRHGHHYEPGHIDIHGGHIDVYSGHGVNHHHHAIYPYYAGYGWESAAPPADFVPPASDVVAPPAPADATPATKPPEPTFGAYERVGEVSRDLVDLANRMCWTLHRDFQNQPTFKVTYRTAYSVFQNAAEVRSLSGDPSNRSEVIKLLELSDTGMHGVVDEVSQWTADPKVAGTPRAQSLQRDVISTGNALHYLMVDAGAKHHEDAETKDNPTESSAEPDAPHPSSLEPSKDAQRNAGAKSPNEPKFGAYANVPTVSADVAKLANRVCLTLHKSFRGRPDFKPAYVQAYELLQMTQRIRDLAREGENREELSKRLEQLDGAMHAFYGKAEEWLSQTDGEMPPAEAKLQDDVNALGEAIHYLMVDVGVEHHEDDDKARPDSSNNEPSAANQSLTEDSPLESGAAVSKPNAEEPESSDTESTPPTPSPEP